MKSDVVIPIKPEGLLDDRNRILVACRPPCGTALDLIAQDKRCKLLIKLVWQIHNQVADLVLSLGAGLDRPAASDAQHLQTLQRHLPALGDTASVSTLCATSGCLGIYRVGLASPAPQLATWPVHLDNLDANCHQIAGEARPVASGPFDPDALNGAEAHQLSL